MQRLDHSVTSRKHQPWSSAPWSICGRGLRSVCHSSTDLALFLYHSPPPFPRGTGGHSCPPGVLSAALCFSTLYSAVHRGCKNKACSIFLAEVERGFVCYVGVLPLFVRSVLKHQRCVISFSQPTGRLFCIFIRFCWQGLTPEKKREVC